MKASMIITALVLLTLQLSAQEFKISKATGRLEIYEVNRVKIVGYSGNEIVFSSDKDGHGQDERAKGLRAISSMGIEDNTGLGISAVDKGNVIEVRQLKRMGGPDITIKVPKSVAVVIKHTSPHGSGIVVNNYDGELDISTIHNKVKLQNVTGQLKVNTVHGDVDVIFDTAPKTPVNIESVHGHVDVTVPTSIKANVQLNTRFGEVLVDPDLKIEIDRSGEMIKYSDKVTGKINGGGLDLVLSATHDNVYLRKK